MGAPGQSLSRSKTFSGAFGAKKVHCAGGLVVPRYIHKICSWHTHPQYCQAKLLMTFPVGTVMAHQNVAIKMFEKFAQNGARI